MATLLSVVDDREDPDVCYWVAWQGDDNPNGHRDVSLYRVFRNDCTKDRAVPITEPLNKQEACERLDQLKLLIGA